MKKKDFFRYKSKKEKRKLYHGNQLQPTIRADTKSL